MSDALDSIPEQAAVSGGMDMEMPPQLDRAESLLSVHSAGTTGTSSSKGSKGSKRKKYGNVPFHEVIKKGGTTKDNVKKKNKESLGDFIKREIFDDGVSQQHSAEDTEAQANLAEHAVALHDDWLKTQVKDLGFDRFADTYDPYSDDMVEQGFRRVQKEEMRSAADTGPSISKERFSSKYWGTWRKEVIILEKKSADEAAGNVLVKELTSHQKLQLKLKQRGVKGVKHQTQLPGTSFAIPRSTRSEYFDSHMQGNRNDAIKIYCQLAPLPKTFVNEALLSVANPDPNAIGNAIKGGAMLSGPRVPKEAKPLTSNIDTPIVDQIKGDVKLSSFLMNRRFDDNAVKKANGGSESPKDMITGPQGNVFGREKRAGPKNKKDDDPGPGHNNVPRMFDDLKQVDYSKTLERIAKEGSDFRAIEGHDMARLAGFSFGCNRQEHILYGFCLDGNCGKRIEFERAFLATNNHRRLGVKSKEEVLDYLPGKELIEKKKSKSTKKELKDMQSLTKKYNDPEQTKSLRYEWISDSVPDPKTWLYPLHLAAKRGDNKAVKKMKLLGLDINLVQGDRKETPLQMAVRGNHGDTVGTILEVFGYLVDVDKQNANGDTALHVATRKGFKEIVESLCDAEANPLLKNDEGRKPLEEAKKFSIQQLLRLQEDSHSLKIELSEVTQELHEQSLSMRNKRSIPERTGTMSRGGGTADRPIGHGYEEVIRSRQSTANTNVSDVGSRTSSKASTRPRSRILELTADRFDPEVDKSKSNMSLFRVRRDATNLEDPKVHSYIMLPPGEDAKKK